MRDVPLPEARRHIHEMLPLAESVREPPEWLDREAEAGTHWRVLGDIAFLVRSGNWVVTIYCRGSMDPKERARRREAKRRPERPPSRGRRDRRWPTATR